MFRRTRSRLIRPGLRTNSGVGATEAAKAALNAAVSKAARAAARAAALSQAARAAAKAAALSQAADQAAACNRLLCPDECRLDGGATIRHGEYDIICFHEKD